MKKELKHIKLVKPVTTSLPANTKIKGLGIHCDPLGRE